MAVPKGKVSSARQNKRRSNVWKLQAPALMKCPQCGEYKTPHRVCGNCGYYNGRAVVKKDAKFVLKEWREGNAAMRSLLFFRKNRMWTQTVWR